MSGEFDVQELEALLDRIQRYGRGASLDGRDARRRVREQFVTMARLLTPAEGSPLEVARAKLRERLPHAKPAVIDELARELVGALGLFPRLAEQQS